MKLVANPNVFNVVFVLKLVDNALADIAEGSDVVRKYFDFDTHLMPSRRIHLWWIIAIPT